MRTLIVAFLLLTITQPSLAKTKDGWSENKIQLLVSSCTNQIVDNARVVYYERAKAVGSYNPKPFPKNELSKSISPMCSCIINKASKSWSYNDFQYNLDFYYEKLLEPAMNGGECSPDGLAGMIINQ